ncbi:MAG: ABC transporter ATP-binding protein [Candidatus Acidiferrales bacterium]
MGVAISDDTHFRAATGSGELVRVEGLRKVFHSGSQEITPLDGISFSVDRGEMISIVGASGAGKSTLLHILAALDTPTSGAVHFGASSLESLNESELAEYRSRAVGFVWQRHHLLPDFTAAENVAMPMLVRGEPMAQALRAAHDWLGEVGLDDRAGQRAGELSGGEQQRVAIARALANGPALLLADEPTGDLDERSAESVFELMKRLHRSHQLTSVLATHNLSLARRTDRILVLDHGKLAPGEGILAGTTAPIAWPASVEAQIPGDLKVNRV